MSIVSFLKTAFESEAHMNARLDAEFAAKRAAKAADRGIWDEELGCFMGQPGSADRFNWIMADEDRQAREDARIAEIIAARG
jgi:hypothetical protein